jgi:carboxymethylenebutenolidase
MYDAMLAESITISGAGGDPVESYLARSMQPGPVGGVVVIHHLPGFDAATKEITRRFASAGYNAICPNLFFREAPGAEPDDAYATVRSMGGVPDDRVVADVAAARDHLRSMSNSNGKVGVVGFCSGGRQTFLVACSIDVDAAVDCYGGFVLNSPPEGMGLNMVPVIDMAGNLSCPLLGLFGEEDKSPSPEETAKISAALDRAGKEHEFHTYPNAGHGFFATDRPNYRPEAATAGWATLIEFYGRHLASAGATANTAAAAEEI